MTCRELKFKWCMIGAILDWSGQKWSLSEDSFNQDLKDKKSFLYISIFMLPGQEFRTNFREREWAWCLRGVKRGPGKHNDQGESDEMSLMQVVAYYAGFSKWSWKDLGFTLSVMKSL